MGLKLRWLIPYLTPKETIELRLQNQQYADEKIARRIKMEGPRGDFFDHVLKKKVGGGGGMTDAELASNAANIVLGGSETTATLLSGTILLLLEHPDVYHKVQDEVRSTFASDDEITMIGVNHLLYMLAVLQEAMRIYPPVPTLASRVVPAGGDTVDGVMLPEGTMIDVCMYAAYHSRANFTRPDQFIPERWTFPGDDKSRSEFANDNAAVLQPFGVGTRNCIGRNLAYAEMRLILAKVLYHFDIAFPGDRPAQHDWMSRQRTWLLWEKDPFWVKLTERRL